MASAPIGCNDTGIERVLTTKCTAILVPFCTQELFMPAPAIYYGLNALSNNMIMADRKRLRTPNGTTVYAAHDGTVTTAAYDSYYGNYVVIEKDGYTTKYAHMDSLSVSAGQSITKGTVIGTTGNTGSSTGRAIPMRKTVILIQHLEQMKSFS